MGLLTCMDVLNSEWLLSPWLPHEEGNVSHFTVRNTKGLVTCLRLPSQEMAQLLGVCVYTDNCILWWGRWAEKPRD